MAAVCEGQGTAAHQSCRRCRRSEDSQLVSSQRMYIRRLGQAEESANLKERAREGGGTLVVVEDDIVRVRKVRGGFSASPELHEDKSAISKGNASSFLLALSM